MNGLLDQLEARVVALLGEIQTLRRENKQLRQDITEKTGPLAEENAALAEALAQEKDARETAAARIDGLLRRLTEHMPE